MLKTLVSESIDLHQFESFDCRTLIVESDALKENPLFDSPVRRHPVLVPKGRAPVGGWPVVFVLSGFTGNGPAGFNFKGFEQNLPQSLDFYKKRGEAPSAVFVFCDAWTKWGGSQFINSQGTGCYMDFLADETYSAVRSRFDVSVEARNWCVSGGSSGGYGALQIASTFPEKFGVLAAIAPDSFFEASLLPDIRAALPVIEKLGGIPAVLEEVSSGRFLKRRDSHTVLNAIAMGLCYAPDGKGGVIWPVDLESGELIERNWQIWMKNDPTVFLKERKDNVSRLSQIYLDAGRFDQFHLQYGTRQIAGILRSLRLNFEHSEFEGNHFDLAERRPQLWAWLRSIWG